MTVRTAALIAALSVLISAGFRILAFNGYLVFPLDLYGYTEIRNIFYQFPFREEHWPYLRFAFQYYPVIGWVSGVFSVLTDNGSVFVLLWALVLAAAAAATAYLLGRHIAPWRVVLFWSASPQLLILSGLNFDTVPTLAMVAAASAVAAERRVLASALLAAGAAAKLFPGAALPLLALHTARRAPAARALVVAAVAAGVLALIAGPAVVAPYSLFGYGHRGPYQLSSWNFNPDTIWTIFGILAERILDPTTAEVLITVISTAGLVLSFVVLCLWPAWRGEPLGGLFWRSVVLILLWSRLYSPQYAIWVLPVLALIVPRPGLLAFLALGDLVTFASIFAIGQAALGWLGSDESVPAVGAMLFGVLVRHAGLILLLRRMLSVHTEVATVEPAPPSAVRWGRAYGGLLALAVVAAIAVNSYVPACTTSLRQWNGYIERVNIGHTLLSRALFGTDLATVHDVAERYRQSMLARPVPCSVVAGVSDLDQALALLSSATTAEQATAAVNDYQRAYRELLRTGRP